MGKQNLPLILGFVNNAARNTFNVSQKQVQNKNVQQKAVKQQKQQKPQQQAWTVVNKKTNTKGTQSFQSWADVAGRNTNWTKQQKTQRPKNEQQKQQKTQQTQTWGWYPASKQEAELKKLYQKTNKFTKQANNKMQNTQQKMKNAMKNNKTKREIQNFKKEQEMKKNFNLLKNINHLYDAFNLRLPSETTRGAWISSNKVGGDKVLSVATLFAIRNAPTTRGKKAFVQRNGQIIFNNKCIRRAVEGRFTGHKKFRGTRVLTYIPEKWLTQDNNYSQGTNEKYVNINGPKRNERCYSFKGVY